MSYVSRRSLMKASLAAALGVAGVSSLSACSSLNPGGTASSSGAEATGAKLTADQVRKAGKVTLSLSDYQSGGMLDALKADIASFHKEFPNVTITPATKDFLDYGKTIALSLSSSSAPDIAEVNAAMAPRLVKAGLLRPLDAYVKAYDWTSQYPKAIDAGTRLSSDGMVFGSGSYFGMAVGGNLVGIFYNKALLKKLGLDVPKAYDEFIAAMAAAKKDGILPLAVGNLDQEMAGHIASTLLVHFEKLSIVNNWINGVNGSSINTPAAVKAIQTIKDWVDAGYISKQANGIKKDDAAVLFEQGKALFNLTGSWRTAEFDKALGNDGGFMLLPGSPVNKAPATGWFSEAWTISKSCKQSDIAAFFLDYMAGPSAQKDNVAGGYLPFANGGVATGGVIAKDVMTGWYQAVDADGLSGYLDSATPTMGTTEFPALQSLISGQKTAQQVIDAMQKDWDDYRAGK